MHQTHWGRMKPGHPKKLPAGFRKCLWQKPQKFKRNHKNFSRLGRIVVFISVWDSQTSFPSLWEALDGKILQSGWCSHHSEILKRISGFQNSIEKPIWNCCILRRYHEIWHSLRTQQQKKTQYKLQKKNRPSTRRYVAIASAKYSRCES